MSFAAAQTSPFHAGDTGWAQLSQPWEGEQLWDAGMGSPPGSPAPQSEFPAPLQLPLPRLLLE